MLIKERLGLISVGNNIYKLKKLCFNFIKIDNKLDM